MLTTLIFTHLLNIASAEPTNLGTYNETEIARNSRLFAEASKVSAPQFAAAESTMNKHASILSTMETSLAFVGLTDSPEWYLPNQKQMLGYRIMVSKHIQLLTTDYDVAFTQAMERAIDALNFDGTISVCEGQSIHAMMGTAPKCEGVALSKSISQNIDNDEMLKTALNELNTLEWPEATFKENTISTFPITGSDYYINTDVIIDLILQKQIQSHYNWLANKNDSIIEGIEAGESEAMDLAVQQREEFKERIAKTGTQFSEAITVYAAKRGKKNQQLLSLAQCPNLPALGGCDGTDITEEFLQMISTDKYWTKSLKKSGMSD